MPLLPLPPLGRDAAQRAVGELHQMGCRLSAFGWIGAAVAAAEPVQQGELALERNAEQRAAAQGRVTPAQASAITRHPVEISVLALYQPGRRIGAVRGRARCSVVGEGVEQGSPRRLAPCGRSSRSR